jgi:pterin-4a-carbinolamine dehydratase
VPLAADLLQEAFKRISALPLLNRLSPVWWQRGGTLALGLLLLYLGPDHVQRVWRFGMAPAAAFRETSYPIEAVQWIKEHRERLGSRPVHDYQYGGFLLWWLPGEKTFIDGRMPAWRVGDRWIFKDYIDVREKDPPRLAVLSKYGVDWALLKRDSPLAQTLGESPDWRREYEDAKVVIYTHDRRGLGGTTYSRTAVDEASGDSGRAVRGSE